MHFKPSLCALAALASLSHIHAAESVHSANTDEPDSRFVILPVPVTDDTLGTGLGLNALYLHDRADGADNPSMSFAYAQYTDSDSSMIILGHEHIFANEDWRAEFYAGLFELNMRHYGFGSAPLPSPVKYASHSQFLYGGLRKKIFENFYVGGHAFWSGGSSALGEDATDEDQFLFEQVMGGSNSALGLLVTYDTRDNIMNPSSGFNLDLSTFHFGKNRLTGNHYHHLEVAFSHYIPVQNKNTIAYKVASINALGDTPLYELPMPELRGFDGNKYKAKNIVQGEVEYRYSFNETWGAVAFAGASISANQFSKLADSDSLFAPMGGLGLRYLVNKEEGLNVSADLATSKDNAISLYLRFGESF